jgi:hypothetical protein
MLINLMARAQPILMEDAAGGDDRRVSGEIYLLARNSIFSD